MNHYIYTITKVNSADNIILLISELNALIGRNASSQCPAILERCLL